MESSSEVGSASPKKTQLRVFFIPFFVPSHLIPMTDLACLFASSRPNVDPTMVVTPANAALIKPTLDRFATATGRHVSILLYPFPSAAVGLPAGLESLSSVPAEESHRIYHAVDLSRNEHDRLLRLHRPDAVVSDIPFWWTTWTARDLGIPRLTFFVVGTFPQCVMNALMQCRQDNNADVITVPDFPGPPVRMPRTELPEFVRSDDNHVTANWAEMKAAMRAAHGVAVNTFYELEPDYCELYRRTDCRKGWFVGPVALAAGRRPAAEADAAKCMGWLDKQEKESVVFVCFGSYSCFKEKQLRELAAGLEASGRPFLLAVKGSEGEVTDPEYSSRGLVVGGWVPQVEILGHPAVGAFMTHCGWNSVMEAVTAGVPVLTWPLVFDQFINERLVVEMIGMGERVWEGFRSTIEEERVVVPAEVIGRAVKGFMEGEAAAARKERAMECAAKARAAVAEGGSSWKDLNSLVDELMELKNKRESVYGPILATTPRLPQKKAAH